MAAPSTVITLQCMLTEGGREVGRVKKGMRQGEERAMNLFYTHSHPTGTNFSASNQALLSMHGPTAIVTYKLGFQEGLLEFVKTVCCLSSLRPLVWKSVV